MAVMTDPHLGWVAPSAYHRICMRHLASNFMTRFKDKLLKNLVCKATLASTEPNSISIWLQLGELILKHNNG